MNSIKNGFNGLNGFNGVFGRDGQVGPRGSQGYGSTGAKGPQGVTGPQGIEGTPGGPTGPQGSQGTTGPKGNDGGPQGFKGSQGFTGSTGPQGITGSQGPQGYIGPTGYGVNLFSFNNTSVGLGTMNGNVGISNNTAFGTNTLSSINNNANTAIGSGVLQYSTTGQNNAAVGSGSLQNSTTGQNNTAVGTNTLHINTIGSNNIAIGFAAGERYTTESNNIVFMNRGITGDNGAIRIGNNDHNSLFVPVRDLNVTGLTGTSVHTDTWTPLYYNSLTKEIAMNLPVVILNSAAEWTTFFNTTNKFSGLIVFCTFSDMVTLPVNMQHLTSFEVYAVNGTLLVKSSAIIYGGGINQGTVNDTSISIGVTPEKRNFSGVITTGSIATNGYAKFVYINIIIPSWYAISSVNCN